MVHELRKLQKFFTYIVLILIGIALVAPFIYMISISLASAETTAKMQFTILPSEFCIGNYISIFTDPRILRWLVNSLVLVTFSIIGQVFASSMVAYGFARLRYKHKNIIFLLLVATMMIPGQITMIPQFFIFSKLKWINTLLPIILPNFFGGAYNIFLTRQFIMSIPNSLDDAAKIDGLGYFGIYRRIILPLIKPVLIAVSLFTFNYNWGAFMEPLIYINDVKRMPLALGVQILSATSNVGATPEWNIVMVASLLLTLPMLIFFMVNQKHVFELNISAGSDTMK